MISRQFEAINQFGARAIVGLASKQIDLRRDATQYLKIKPAIGADLQNRFNFVILHARKALPDHGTRIHPARVAGGVLISKLALPQFLGVSHVSRVYVDCFHLKPSLWNTIVEREFSGLM